MAPTEIRGAAAAEDDDDRATAAAAARKDLLISGAERARGASALRSDMRAGERGSGVYPAGQSSPTARPVASEARPHARDDVRVFDVYRLTRSTMVEVQTAKLTY